MTVGRTTPSPGSPEEKQKFTEILDKGTAGDPKALDALKKILANDTEISRISSFVLSPNPAKENISRQNVGDNFVSWFSSILFSGETSIDRKQLEDTKNFLTNI